MTNCCSKARSREMTDEKRTFGLRPNHVGESAAGRDSRDARAKREASWPIRRSEWPSSVLSKQIRKQRCADSGTRTRERAGSDAGVPEDGTKLLRDFRGKSLTR